MPRSREPFVNTALLLIDIQNDYFPGGTMELSGADAAASNAARLLKSFRARAMPVFHVQHIATRPGATFFLPDTRGAEIHDAVKPAAGETTIVKHFPNCFRETRLLEALRAGDISQLVVAGMMTHMCVDTTVRAAADLGFSCTLAADACATKDLVFDGERVDARNTQLAYLAALNGAFATVQSTDRLCERP
jgi:nicotinamidase-related amidase